MTGRISTTKIALRRTAIGLLLIASPLSAADPLPFTVAWSTPAQTTSQQGRLEQYGTLPDGRAVFLGVPASAPAPDIYGADKAILLFDPATDAFVWKSLLPAAIRHYAVVLLPLADGKVFVLGQNTSVTSSKPPWYAFMYDPATDAFTAKATLSLPYQTFDPVTRFQLPGGAIYIGGGAPSATGRADGFIYDPVANTWSTGPATPISFSHSAESAKGLVALGGGRFFRAGIKPGTSQLTSAAIFDPVTMSWAMHATLDFANGVKHPAAIQDHVYGAALGISGNDSQQLIRYGLADNTFTLVEHRTNVTALMGMHCFALRAAGRDHLCTVTSAPEGSASFGRFDSKVLNPQTGAWVNLPQSPTAILESNNYAIRSTALRDGFILVVPFKGGAVKSQRLRLTSGTGAVAPYVDPVGMPTAIALNEGGSLTIGYRVVGDIPPTGVTVVVERSQGDGDVRVLDVNREPIASASTTRTARILALIDADGANDAASIRLRVVQAGGAPDPKAITIPVTVTDRYQEASHKPGDVNGDNAVNALDLDQVIESFGN